MSATREAYTGCYGDSSPPWGLWGLGDMSTEPWNTGRCSSREKVIPGRDTVYTKAGPSKGRWAFFTLGFLGAQATILSCPKYSNYLLTGVTISNLIFLWSIHNTVASVILLKLKVSSYDSLPQTLRGLQAHSKEELESLPCPTRGCMFCLSLALFIFWPHRLIIFPSFCLWFSHTGLLAIPQTYPMCSGLRPFERADPAAWNHFLRYPNGFLPSPPSAVCSKSSS